MLPLSPSIGMLELMAVLVVGVGIEVWLGGARVLFPRLWHGLCAPLLRSAVVIAAVLTAYPALFGFRAAPSLATLIAAEAAHGGMLLGLVFVCRLLAPALPALQRRPGMLDAAQGVAAVAVIFTCFADYLGALSVSVWPGLLAAIALAGLGAYLPALAAGLGADFGAGLDSRYHSARFEPLCGAIMGMVAVAPIVMLYGYLLGMQLAM